MTAFAQSIHCILPECLLAAVACVQFLVGPFLVADGHSVQRKLGRLWGSVSIASLLVAWWIWQSFASHESVGGMFRDDRFADFFRGVGLIAGLVLVLINWDQILDEFAAEFHGLLLLIVAGIGLTAAANDLVVLFLALELVSIPTYVFLYLPRRDPTSPEATTKYFFLSIFSSAIVLYGFSFLYGAVGSTHLDAIQMAVDHYPAARAPSILLIAAACIVAGLSFRVTAAPFHFYAPDVFQGSHAGAGALLAVVPKLVGFVALLRLVHFETANQFAASTGESLRVWCSTLFWILAVASMFLGNVLALLQQNLKRLLAYSSVAHAGYMLVGLAVAIRVGAVGGIAATLFYLVAYAATIAGVFGLIILLRQGTRPVQSVDDLAGLSQTHPAAAGVMTILLFSLTGLPPTGGFLGKLNLLMAAWSQGTPSAQILAVLLAINAAIAAAYYLRIVAVMYLRPAGAPVQASRSFPAAIGIALCVLVSLGLFFYPNALWELVDQFVA
jgi:NADH-quinone oxidoreductase subunit N